MTALEARILERLRHLSAERVAEVVDFVDFLAACEERAEAGGRPGEALAKIDALNLPPLTEEEVEEEIQAARAERRAQRGA
ncbi:MAG: hypothetical protein MUF30_00580 [Burkholderiales bacterium]|jgi:hypothetical protein|nr:hypothetical protein [Burkholderiales bacterium]